MPEMLVMPMRDGVLLRACLWRPPLDAAVPVVLLRTPYAGGEADFERLGLAAYVDAGYAVAVQWVRGTGESQGEFGFFFVEGKDGYDSIEWLAAQPWCNGQVAMDGGSYLGTAQWLAARERPPHLACIMPAVPAGDYFNEIPLIGGALQIDWAFSWLSQLAGQSFEFDASGDSNLERFRPLREAESVLGWSLPLYRELLDHPRLDDWWRRIQFEAADFARIEVPALITSGWFDGDQAGAMFYWQGIEKHGSRAADSRLVLGPWQHHQCYLGGERRVEQMDCGADSLIDLRALRLAFLEHHLRGGSLWPQRVRYYLTGAQAWREAPAWPAGEAQDWYLDSGGAANTRAGDGRLSTAPGGGPADQFVFDPADPVPYRPGAADHGELEDRQDVLVYSSAPLAEALDVAGPVELCLYAASDAPDTDFTAKLLDVDPEGKALSLTHVGGVLRARYREGFDREVALTPGEPACLRIRLSHVGHRFLPGHRLRLEVSSSCFPLADPNPNTGRPVADETEVRRAHQRVLHDAQHRSRLRLPVLR